MPPDAVCSWTSRMVLLGALLLLIIDHHRATSSGNEEGARAALRPGGAQCPGDRLRGLLSFAWSLPPAPPPDGHVDDAVRLLHLRSASLFADEEALRRLVEAVALGETAAAPLGNASVLHYLAAADDTARLRLLLPHLLWTRRGPAWWLHPRDIIMETPLHWAARFNALGAIHALLERDGLQTHDSYSHMTQEERLQLMTEVEHHVIHWASRRRTNGENETLTPLPLYLRTPLHTAAESGHVGAIDALLRAGANIDAKDYDFTTPLGLATKNESLEAFRFLLEHGADIFNNDALHRAAGHNNIIAMRTLLYDKGVDKNIRDTEGRTPLHRAAEPGNLAAMKMLIDLRADVNAQDHEDRTPLTLAAELNNVEAIRLLVNANASMDGKLLSAVADKKHLADLKALIELGADVNNFLAHFAFFRAVEDNNEEGVKVLLAAGANANVMRCYMHSLTPRDPSLLAKVNLTESAIELAPVHWASALGRVAVLKALIDGRADPNIKDLQGKTPLMWSAIKNDREGIRVLVQAGAHLEDRDTSELTALHWAARVGSSSALRTLVALGAAINAQDIWGFTSLHWLELCGDNTNSAKSCTEHSADDAEILISAGANVNARNKQGRTPLMFASSFSESASALHVLFNAGARLEDRTNKAMTALHLSLTNSLPILQALLDLGANVKATDDEGRTALHQAMVWNNTDAVTPLLKAGAHPNARDTKQRTPVYYAALSGREDALRTLLNVSGVDVSARDADGRTALSVAVEACEDGAVRILAKAGADLEERDHAGRTAVHWASTAVSFVTPYRARTARTLRTLVELGAAVNVSDFEGNSPLHLAVKEGDEDTVETLLLLGADLNARDSKGRTPLIRAAREGNALAVELLGAAGADLELRDDEGLAALHHSVFSLPERRFSRLDDVGDDGNGDNDYDDGDRRKEIPVLYDLERGVYVLRVLLGLGAVVDAVDREGVTARCLALGYKNSRAAALLAERGSKECGVALQTLIKRSRFLRHRV